MSDSTFDIDKLITLSDALPSGVLTLKSGDGLLDQKAKFPSTCKVLVYSEEDCDVHPIADFSCNWSCRLPFEQEAIAQFFVELVNSWPIIRQLISERENHE